VTNGVDGRRFTRPQGTSGQACRARIGAEGRFLFLTVGGLEPRKNSLALIEALAAVRSRTARCPLLAVVGEHSFQDHSSYRDSVLNRAEELGLQVGSDIHLLGTVPDSLLPAWYHAADAFVFPSTKEGWGLAVLEAMSAELPVVASDIPVFREYLDRDDALLVAPHDHAALAHAMYRLIVDPGLRASLARRGREVAARYTWDQCARQHMAFYRTLRGRIRRS
jgi:glycosyltransferase involved in cell wall biosynthesis